VRSRPSCLILFLGILLLSVSAHAQTQITMQASPHFCGHVSSPLYCYGIPVTVQIGANGGNAAGSGTMWLDIYSNNTGFVVFNTPSFQTTATITGATRTFNNIGQVTSIYVAFAGSADPEADGDTDTYTGSLTLNFAYQYVTLSRSWNFSVVSGGVNIASQ